MPHSQPNYLKTGSDGSVTADFSGGVTMPLQNTFVTAQQGASVAWTDGPGGAKLAWVGASKTAANGQVVAGMFSKDSTGLRQSQVLAYATPASDSSSVRVAASGSVDSSSEVLLINNRGQSDFVKGSNASLFAGWFNGFGAVGGSVNTTQVVGPTITVSKSATGIWSFDLRPLRFTNSPAFAYLMAGGNGAGTGTPAGGIAIKMQDGAAPNANFLQLLAYNTQTWATTDISFLYLLAGPSAWPN